jgi:hypothetical protein
MNARELTHNLVGRRAQVERTVGDRLRECLDCGDASAGEAETVKVGREDFRRTGEEMGKSRNRRCDPPARALYHAPDQRQPGGEAHLLPDDRAQRALERIPHAGNPQPRPPFDQRRQNRIVSERVHDRRRLGGEIEYPLCDSGKMRKRRGVGTAYPKLQRIFAIDRPHADDRPTDLGCDYGAGISPVVGDFDSCDRARREESLQMRPIVRRAICESEHGFVGSSLGFRPDA